MNWEVRVEIEAIFVNHFHARVNQGRLLQMHIVNCQKARLAGHLRLIGQNASKNQNFRPIFSPTPTTPLSFDVLQWNGAILATVGEIGRFQKLHTGPTLPQIVRVQPVQSLVGRRQVI